MSTLELSSIVLEIPNDAFTTLSRNLIGCWPLFNIQLRVLQADGLTLENNENINMPSLFILSMKTTIICIVVA